MIPATLLLRLCVFPTIRMCSLSVKVAICIRARACRLRRPFILGRLLFSFYVCQVASFLHLVCYFVLGCVWVYASEFVRVCILPVFRPIN